MADEHLNQDSNGLWYYCDCVDCANRVDELQANYEWDDTWYYIDSLQMTVKDKYK